ncbi:MAG: DUF4105 domain-containing protein [Duncaniella sp.]|nr:DUF4105 domain-containing protein [Duncaniella sp.]
MTFIRSLLFILLLFPTIVSAQENADSLPLRPVVSFLTCSEGPEIYELEGHTAIRVVDPVNGTDYVVNWGIFDFAAPNFVYRFVKGETDYMSGTAPTRYFLSQYALQGRTVTEQKLNLTPCQTDTLIAMIEDCVRPENRVYRYNYVYDNCSTRALSFVEKAIGDTLALAQSSLPPGTDTFRKVMARFHTNYPWYQFGIDLALGSGIDKRLTHRELSFAPVVLCEMLENATDGSGNKIVSSTDYLIDNHDSSPVEGPTPWYATPLATALYLLVVSAALTFRDIRRHRLSRWFDTILFSVFGLAGCVITFLVFISVHEATSPNWLLMWLNPLCFLPAILTWVKRGKDLLLWYHFLNFATLIVLVNLLVFGVQSPNAAFYPLIAADLLRSLANICVTIWSKRHRR